MANAQRGLCRLRRCTKEFSKLSLGPHSRRSFSQATVRLLRKSTFPAWTESSNTELNDALVEVRQKMILPFYVNKEQKELISKEENRSILEADPITTRIGEVDITLEYTDFMDLPNRNEGISRLLGMVQQPEDWENIAKLLEAFEGSHEPLSISLKGKILRRIIYLHQFPLALKIMRAPDQYGIRVYGTTFIHELVASIYMSANSGEWEEERTKSALTFAEMIADTLLLDKVKSAAGSNQVLVFNGISQLPQRDPFLSALFLKATANLEQSPEGRASITSTFSACVDRFLALMEGGTFVHSGYLNGPWLFGNNRRDRPRDRLCLELSLLTWDASNPSKLPQNLLGQDRLNRLVQVNSEIEERLRRTVQTHLSSLRNRGRHEMIDQQLKAFGFKV